MWYVEKWQCRTDFTLGEIEKLWHHRKMISDVFDWRNIMLSWIWLYSQTCKIGHLTRTVTFALNSSQCIYSYNCSPPSGLMATAASGQAYFALLDSQSCLERPPRVSAHSECLPACIVCSLQENLALHWFSIESEVFIEWTDYTHMYDTVVSRENQLSIPLFFNR